MLMYGGQIAQITAQEQRCEKSIEPQFKLYVCLGYVFSSESAHFDYCKMIYIYICLIISSFKCDPAKF